MKRASLLILSAAVNVALAVAAVQLLRPPVNPQPPPAAAPVAQAQVVRVVTNLPPETTFVTNAFHWRQLESTNYDAFVANLRDVGCPERTVRDIIVADVWSRYLAAKRSEDYSLPFWESGPRRAAAERAREAALIQLKADLASLLQRLFGIAWSPSVQRGAFDEGQLLCRVLLGDVTEEQFERAVGLLGRVEDLKDEARWQARDILLDEDYAALARRRDDLERALRAVLSPAQFEEFRARVGVAERLLGNLFGSDDFEGLEPTPDELRRIALAQTEVWPLGWEMLDLEDSETDEQKEAREQAMKTRMRGILGEERYAETERLRDGDYRNIHRFAKENQLPKAIAHQLHEIQKLARDEVRQAREDKSVGTDARSERIAAVTAAVAPQVSELLGPRVFASYLQQTGRWVTNANQL